MESIWIVVLMHLFVCIFVSESNKQLTNEYCKLLYVSLGLQLPGKPGRPVVNKVVGRKATIKWAPPDSDGGSKIIQYVIYYGSADVDLESLSKRKFKERSNSCKFTLRFDKMYKFAVAAENKAGIGPLSEFSEVIKTPDRAGWHVVFLYFFVLNFFVN